MDGDIKSTTTISNLGSFLERHKYLKTCPFVTLHRSHEMCLDQWFTPQFLGNFGDYWGLSYAPVTKHGTCLWPKETNPSILRGSWEIHRILSLVLSMMRFFFFPLVIFDLQHGRCHVEYGSYVRTLRIFTIYEIVQ